MFQGIAVNDQDKAENDANLVEAARVASLLAQEAQDSQDDEDGDELEQEFATDEEEAGDDLTDEEYANEMKNKMAALFEIDQDEEDPMSELDVLSLEEAAVYLKVNYSDIRQMLKEQGLPGRKIGSEWRFLRGAIADWLRNPAGVTATPVVPPAARVERPREEQRPAREEQRPQREERPRRRFPEEMAESGQGYPEQSRPPRPRPEFRSQGQFGAAPAGGPPAGGGQGGSPPPRRGRYADQQQQPPQGEYQPPPRKRPFQGQAGGNAGGPPSGGRRFAGGQGGAGQGGAGQGGTPQGGAGRFSSGPKAPKREALGNQRFKRLDRRRFGGDQGE